MLNTSLSRYLLIPTIIGLLLLSACSSTEKNTSNPESENEVTSSQKQPQATALNKSTENDADKDKEESREEAPKAPKAPIFNWNISKEDIRLIGYDYANLDRETQDQAVNDWLLRQRIANPEFGSNGPEAFKRGLYYKENGPEIANITSTTLTTLFAFLYDNGNQQLLEENGILEGPYEYRMKFATDDTEFAVSKAKHLMVEHIVDSLVGKYVINRDDVISAIMTSLWDRSIRLPEEPSREMFLGLYNIDSLEELNGYPMKHTEGADIVYDIAGTLIPNENLSAYSSTYRKMFTGAKIRVTYNYGGKIFGFEEITN